MPPAPVCAEPGASARIARGTEGSETSPAARGRHNGSFVHRGGKEQPGAEDAVGSAARWRAGPPGRPAPLWAAARAECRTGREKNISALSD